MKKGLRASGPPTKKINGGSPKSNVVFFFSLKYIYNTYYIPLGALSKILFLRALDTGINPGTFLLTMKKLYQHVFQTGSKWTFRCQLPGHAFQAEETFDCPADAAYHKDLFFLFLLRKFSIPAALLKPSLPHPVLLSMLREVGLDTHNLSDLFTSLPTSCRDFIRDGGGESILETIAERKGMKGFGDL